ncbi:uncharacterized protein G2W53_010427 [Senna tora]|uniref:Uncharacterized protein n=1 Tax=Senna tora TaxID=362788 RepID=A0A834WZU0_9FABA|nr:uncharacterized protein G2W53_010427 [Senna tora]
MGSVDEDWSYSKKMETEKFINHSLKPLETALVLKSSDLDEKELEQEEHVTFKMLNSIESPKDNEKCLKAKVVKEMGKKESVIGGSKDHQIDPGETPQKSPDPCIYCYLR